MESLKRQARLAGFWYLSLALVAPFSLIYVPGRVLVPGDAAATAANVLGNELLYRTSIVVRLVIPVLFMFAVLALYHLLERIDRRQALTMAALALVSVPLGYVAAASSAGALVMLGGADFLGVFSMAQRAAMALVFIKLAALVNTVEAVFWGLWLLPFGVLVYRSRFLPRFLGVVIVLNGVAYVVDSAVKLLAPAHQALVSRMAMPFLLGEVLVVVWLIAVGPRQPRVMAQA